MNYPQTSYSGEIITRPTGPVAVPGAGSPLMAGGIQYAPITTPEQPAKRSAFHRLDKFAPLLASTPVTIAGRIWHYHGAAHSYGDATLLGLFSVGSLVASAIAAATKSVVLVGAGLALTGGLAAAAVAGYAHGWTPESVLWAAATTLGYGVKWPAWRHEEHRAEDRQERMGIATLTANTTIQTELIRGQVQLGVAATQAQAYVTGEQIKADALRDVSSRIPTPQVPDADPSIFNLSRSGQAALAEPVTMPAASEFGFARAEHRQAA